MKFYLSTTADFAPSYENPEDMGPCAPLAAEHGLGLEIAEFCICSDLDERRELTERLLKRKRCLVSELLLHAPFNELCPAAIDPMIREVAEKRFLQTFEIAAKYGMKKLVVHTGFDPMIYRKEWFIPQSVQFWKKLLKKKPEGLMLVLENVMETDPEIPLAICEEVNDPDFRLCLDIGHANLMPVPVNDWITAYGPLLSHLHIHNNAGSVTKGIIAAKDDTHSALGDGILDIEQILRRLKKENPDVTVTVETTKIKESVEWLTERSLIR